MIPNKLIIPDHKLYFTALDDEDEAHYVCRFLNSLPVRTWLGGFLLGKQIGTSIYENMNVPRFDRSYVNCKRIAILSREAHQKRIGMERKTNAYLNESVECSLEKYIKSCIGYV